MFLNKGSKESSESGKSNVNIGTEQNNDTVKENDEDESGEDIIEDDKT